MTKEREALKLAIEALEKLTGPADLVHLYDALDLGDVAITAIKEVLAQPSDSVEPTHTPEQLAALGWQSIECPFCGTSGAQAFSKSDCDWEGIAADQAMTIALLKSEQEPAAWMTQHGNIMRVSEYDKWIEFDGGKGCENFSNYTIPLYRTPPKREWVGLTEKASELVYEDVSGQSLRPQDYRLVLRFAVAVEAKLKELNHG